jgi:ABC-type multidrug transport system fused ATPase/permease subunit
MLLTALPMTASAAAQAAGVLATSVVIQIVAGQTLSGWLGVVEAQVGRDLLTAMAALVVAGGGIVSWVALAIIVRVSWESYEDVATHTLQAVLASPVDAVAKRNASGFAKEVINDSYAIVTQIIGTGMDIAQRVLMSAAIISALVVIFPLGVIAFVAVGGSYYFVVSVVGRGRASAVSAGRYASATALTESVSEAVSGIREVRLGFADSLVVEIQRQHIRRYSESSIAGHLLQRGPRFALEAVAVVVLVALGMAGGDASLPAVGAFAVGLFRLLPALQVIYSGLVTMNLASPALDHVEMRMRGAEYLEARRGQPIDFSVFEVDGVAVVDDSVGVLVEGFSASFRPSEVVAIRGPSGSGKTSILDAICGLRPYLEGDMRVDQASLGDPEVRRNWMSSIGYASQTPMVFSGSIADNVFFSVPEPERSPDMLRRALIVSGLDALSPDGRYLVASGGTNLSGGQRQRLAIARAVVRSPKVVVLDEATSGLDEAAETQLLQSLKKELPTALVIIVSHRGSTVAMADRVIEMPGRRRGDA